MVEFNPNTLNLSDPAMLATLADVNFQDLDLQTELTQIPPAWIKRAFPTHNGIAQTILSDLGKTITLPDMSNVFTINFDNESDLESVLSFLETHDAVIFVNKQGQPVIATNDSFFSYDMNRLNPAEYQWSLNNEGGINGYTYGADINVVPAWNKTTGSTNVRLGISDFGVRGSTSAGWNEHFEFTGKTLLGTVGFHSSGFINHGMHVAGIIGAKENNNIGIAGIDWNATLVIDTIAFSDAKMYLSFVKFIQFDTNVINCSWDWAFLPNKLMPVYSVLLRRAFALTYKANILNVATTGNYANQTNVVRYPGGFGQGVLTIGASNQQDKRTSYSNYGTYLDVVAPGDSIWSLAYDGSPAADQNYAFMSGVSQAAPHVTGIAGLMLAYAEELGLTLYNDDLENIIKHTAEQVGGYSYDSNGFNLEMGHGRVDAYEAVKALDPSHNTFYQNKSGSGSSVLVAPQIPQTFYDGTGLPTGAYDADVYEVTTSVSFPYIESPKVWTRGVETKGWNFDGQNNFTMGWGEVSNVTSTSATLKTYVYHVLNPNGNGYLGWYPVAPQDVEIAFTAWGANATQPLPDAPTNLVINNAGQLGVQPQLAWTDPNGNGMVNTFEIYRCEGGTGTGAQSCTNYANEPIGVTSSTNYTDNNVYMVPVTFADGRYFYKVRAVNASGNSGYSNETSTTGIQLGKTGDDWLGENSLPTDFSLSNIYPNPFIDQATLRMALPTNGTVNIDLYDVLGHRVSTLNKSEMATGYHTINWRPRNLSSGVYLCKIVVELENGQTYQAVRKLIKTN